MRHLPHFIIEEIFSYLTADEQSEFLTTNKHICKTLLQHMVKNLRFSYPMSDSFYSIILPKFGSQVCNLKVGFFDKKCLSNLPNVSKIAVLENYHVSVEQNIEDILKQYPKLIELDLSQMMLQSDIASIVSSLNKLVALRLPDFYSEPMQVHSFLEGLVTPSLRFLSLEMPMFNHQVMVTIAKNLPNLTCLSITSEEVFGDREKMLDVKLQHLTAFELMITCPDVPRDDITFRPSNFPSLTALSISPLVSFEVAEGRTFPLVKEFLLYHLDKQLINSFQEHFSHLKSLVLICDKISSELVNEALKNGTNLERIQLHRVNEQAAFKDLPAKEYRAHTFSLISSCPFQSSFFLWLSACFPRLHRLSFEFDLLSNVSFDAVPFGLEQPFNSLAILQTGGRFPAIWIHQIIRYSPRLDILGLDLELYSKHSKRFSTKYTALSVFVSSAFDHEEASSDSESESDFEHDGDFPNFTDSESD